MKPEKVKTPRAALRAIPTEARPAMCEWLDASADNAEETATRLRLSNVKPKDSQVEAMAVYWDSIAAAARLLRSRLASASPRVRKSYGDTPDGAS